MKNLSHLKYFLGDRAPAQESKLSDKIAGDVIDVEAAGQGGYVTSGIPRRVDDERYFDYLMERGKKLDKQQEQQEDQVGQAPEVPEAAIAAPPVPSEAQPERYGPDLSDDLLLLATPALLSLIGTGRAAPGLKIGAAAYEKKLALNRKKEKEDKEMALKAAKSLGTTNKQALAVEKDLRNLFVKDKGVREAYEVYAHYNNLKAGIQDASSLDDISFIFSFMKVLDPGSVVREGEQVLVRRATSVPNEFKTLIDRWIRGKDIKLQPPQRREMMEAVERIASTRIRQATQFKDFVEQTAIRSGGDPRNIVYDFEFDLKMPEGVKVRRDEIKEIDAEIAALEKELEND